MSPQSVMAVTTGLEVSRCMSAANCSVSDDCLDCLCCGFGGRPNSDDDCVEAEWLGEQPTSGAARSRPCSDPAAAAVTLFQGCTRLRGTGLPFLPGVLGEAGIGVEGAGSEGSGKQAMAGCKYGRGPVKKDDAPPTWGLQPPQNSRSAANVLAIVGAGWPLASSVSGKTRTTQPTTSSGSAHSVFRSEVFPIRTPPLTRRQPPVASRFHCERAAWASLSASG
mmetsp:Transcript_25921/g.59756  ORF Transcript_25921/g.59756 Transcript_25921/m.59756 type:complete len:222 (-) Transcript_25921:1565-2230(-)